MFHIVGNALQVYCQRFTLGGMRHRTPTTDIDEAVSAEVRAMLGRTRSTQKDLAEFLELSQPAISQRLLGRVPWTLRELQEAADYFDCSVTDLIPDFRSRWSLEHEADRQTAGQVTLPFVPNTPTSHN